MNLFLIFLTGLTSGGLSCLAMQGGLLASVIANQKNRELVKPLPNSKQFWNSFDQWDWLPVLVFLVSKLAAHTILGFGLGWLGSTLTLSLEFRLAFQVLAALFMLGTAFNLLELHPVFRYLSFTPPKFLQKLIRRSAHSQALFAPAILGLATIFIPCGVTQAMEVTAISSGNPVTGALIMFMFVLGTFPLFALLGVATAKLSESWHQRFAKVAAAALIAMAIFGLNGVLLVTDSPLSLQRVFQPITYFFSSERFNSQVTSTTNGIQEVTIKVLNNGYQPNFVRVKQGLPVRLTLESSETYSCALSFVFPEFKIKTFLAASDSQSFEFTPNRKGRFAFTCSMGMYSGLMEVI